MRTTASVRTLSRPSLELGALVTARGRMLPSFLVIGGKRCGSTSLYEYVIQHPAVLPPRVRKGTHYFDVNFHRNWTWFRSKFPTQRRARRLEQELGVEVVTGEASPYYMSHPSAPARIARALPGARLIAVLRDPVERAWSHYRYSVQHGFEHLPVAEAFDAEPARLEGEVERLLADSRYSGFAYRHHSYLTRGLYAHQLDAVASVFPSAQILVLQSEQLFTEPNVALARVFRFLGLPPMAFDDLPVYKAGLSSEMPLGIRRRLQEYYAEPNERLYTLPGIGFRWGTHV
ncbi:MAG: sulfotransferase domain-containing protein [Gaiellales bacterium]